MRFDLTDLRLFLAVLEHGSLTRGAAAANLAPASASERVAGMESALGAALLRRHRRGVEPTAAGEALARHARLILGQMEQMRGELRGYARGLKGSVRLLANTAAMAQTLPPRLCRFLIRHPDLSIDLEEKTSADIVLDLAQGKAELGAIADIADFSALQTRVLAHDHLLIATAPGHRLAGLASVKFDAIAGEAFVGAADAALQAHLDLRAARLGRRLHYRIRLKEMQDVARLVHAGVGIAVVSSAAMTRMSSHADVAFLPLDESWAHRTLHLCARDFGALSVPAALLAQGLREADAANAADTGAS
ncbi:LysR substrate-binding domain-containing protein [Candidimonas nitroreducens]|uniref:LysR family transcriptional regulator n=1 Tax=Candidimonas nitroreducens TaxID=683354 RepID=A0A225LZ63_9BURK|nr:LysR substrate-binding domain-containing protein [Candidimonas nitroreducens]OWT53792.1 LysR family transcriptional regulator [Candidimonas nitroreducens]